MTGIVMRVTRRLRGVARDERGAGWFLPSLLIVTGFVAVACVSLVIDGGRVAGGRRHADSIAFQAARVAAQELTQNAAGEPIIEPFDAREVAVAAAGQLFAANGLSGTVTEVTVTDTEVTVTTSVTRQLTTTALFGTGAVTVSGTATVRIAQGVVDEIDAPADPFDVTALDGASDPRGELP
jgi:Flp pilus assembly protein TadG